MAENYHIIVAAHHGVRALAIALGLLGASGVIALAQEAELSTSAATTTTPPYASFQYATLTGTTDTVSVSLLPVVNSSGKTVLENVTLQFGFDSSGNLIVSSLKAAPAPTPIVTNFEAGPYTGPTTINPSMFITISGPGLTTGGATEWDLTTSSGAWYDTYPETAFWYDGPVTSNPIYPRIQAAGITSTAWSYGIGGNQYGGDKYDWFPNSLLGFSQVGNTLTIVTFTDNNGKDHNLPQDQVTYTFQ